MIETPNIPAELLARAFHSRNGEGEFAWQFEDAPDVVRALTDAGYAVLGGEGWLVRPNGSITGLFMVAPDTPPWFYSWSLPGAANSDGSWQKDLESWEQFCQRTAAHSLEVIVGDGTDLTGLKRFCEDVKEHRPDLAPHLW